MLIAAETWKLKGQSQEPDVLSECICQHTGVSLDPKTRNAQT